MTEKVSTNYLAGLVFLVILLVYWMTTGTSLTSGDSGELAAAQYHWGIAHAPGYPIYTLLGYIWSHLLYGFSPLASLNLLSGIFAAMACGICFLLIFRILESISSLEKSVIALISLVSALSIGFSDTFWSQAVGVEVYSLHSLIVSISLLIAVKLVSGKDQSQWIWLGLAIGIGFAHHLTIVLIGPALIYVVYDHWKSEVLSISQLIKGIGLGLVVIISSWVMLMLRSKMDPALDCGNPENLKNLIFHITGSPYQGYTFQSMDEAWYNLRFIVYQLPKEFSVLGLIIGLIGIRSLFLAHRTLAIFFSCSLVTNIVIAINYAITDLNAYFLLAYVSIGVFIACGLSTILSRFIDGKHQSRLSALAFLLPLYLLMVNFSSNNFKEYKDIELYYEESVEALPEKAILFTMDFETDISASYYYQLVENRRRDITIVDMISITNYDWFGNHLLKNDTVFFGSCVERYRELCEIGFELKSEGYRAQQISTEMFECLFESHLGSRPIYMSHWAYSEYFRPGGPIDILENYSVVPQEFFYFISKDKSYVPFEGIPEYDLISPKLNDSYTTDIEAVSKRRSFILRNNKYISDFIRHRQARMLDHRIQYELKQDSVGLAIKGFEALETYFPKYQLHPSVKSQLRPYLTN